MMPLVATRPPSSFVRSLGSKIWTLRHAVRLEGCIAEGKFVEAIHHETAAFHRPPKREWAGFRLEQKGLSLNICAALIGLS